TGEHYDEDDIADELADTSIDLGRDTLGVVDPDGALIGWTAVRVWSNVAGVDRVWLEGGVLPSRRGEGLGHRLLDWGERRAHELHVARHPDLPGELFVRVPATVPSQEALVRAAGRAAPAGARRGVRRPLGLDPARRAALDPVVHRLPRVPARAEPARARRRPDRGVPAQLLLC